MKLSELLQGYEQRSAEEALSEVERELNMREKCFVRWIGEGRISRIDARDRLSRLRLAFDLLTGFVMRTQALSEASGGDASKMCAEVAESGRKSTEKPVDGAETF